MRTCPPRHRRAHRLDADELRAFAGRAFLGFAPACASLKLVLSATASLGASSAVANMLSEGWSPTMRGPAEELVRLALLPPFLTRSGKKTRWCSATLSACEREPSHSPARQSRASMRRASAIKGLFPSGQPRCCRSAARAARLAVTMRLVVRLRIEPRTAA